MESIILFSMLLSTKYMLPSVLGISKYLLLIAMILNVIGVLWNSFSHQWMTKSKLIVIALSFVTMLLINVAKLNSDLFSVDDLYPTDIFIFSAILVVISTKYKLLINAVIKYLNLNALVISFGIVLFLLDTFKLISPIGLVSAPDHANLDGYQNLYYLAYYPSWISFDISGIVIHRFASVFWEPGTLGLYLIAFILIEALFFVYKHELFNRRRGAVFLISGILSLSLLFYLLIFPVVLFILFYNKKWVTLSIIITFIALALIYFYDQLYNLIFYRLEFDSERGFVGNNRSSAFDIMLNSMTNTDWITVLVGYGPNAIFLGDSTSFPIKIYQRGLLGAGGLVLLIIYSTLVFPRYKIAKLFAFILMFGLFFLTQIEGAIISLYFIILMLASDTEFYKFYKPLNKVR